MVSLPLLVMGAAGQCDAKATAVFARADLGTESESRPIRDYLDDVLTKPMTLAEITVAVVEAGLRTRMAGRELRNYVGRELKESGYRRDGERCSKR